MASGQVTRVTKSVDGSNTQSGFIKRIKYDSTESGSAQVGTREFINIHIDPELQDGQTVEFKPIKGPPPNGLDDRWAANISR